MVELRATGVLCTVSPDDGGRIAALEVFGRHLLRRHDTSFDADPAVPMMWGCYPMAPFAGRVRFGRFDFDGNSYQLDITMNPHAIHGTVYTQPWSVSELDDSSVSMSCALGDHWPFGGAAHQRIEVFADRIECRLTVTADELAMPVTIGWHPWFVKPDSTELRFARMYRRDDVGIPTGARIPPPTGPWDDCFVEPLAPLRLDYDDLIVTITSDCDHWVVYDQPHDATCVEPQSGPPDGFNQPGGAVRLDPHESIERTMTISWTTV